MNREVLHHILERVCRYYVCIFLLLYGVGKLAGGQFYRRGQLPEEVANTTLGEALPFDLAWTFMGYSGAYVAFIGVSQVIGALLLLNRRTTLLGVTILIPIMLNIVVFDIIFLDAYGALASAVIYLLLLLLILYFNRDLVKKAFRALTQVQAKVEGARKARWQMHVMVFTLMGILFGFNQLLLIYLGY